MESNHIYLLLLNCKYSLNTNIHIWFGNSSPIHVLSLHFPDAVFYQNFYQKAFFLTVSMKSDLPMFIALSFVSWPSSFCLMDDHKDLAHALWRLLLQFSHWEMQSLRSPFLSTVWGRRGWGELYSSAHNIQWSQHLENAFSPLVAVVAFTAGIVASLHNRSCSVCCIALSGASFVPKENT